MIAYHGDECGTLADKVKCGAKVCTECWPTEEIQLLDGVLGACVAVQAAKELRRGRVSGLRVPGSWQRHAESSQLSERLRDPGEARIFEVKFEDRACEELLTLAECRQAIDLRVALDAAVQAAVLHERKRLENHHGHRERQLRAELAQYRHRASRPRPFWLPRAAPHAALASRALLGASDAAFSSHHESMERVRARAMGI